MSDKVFVDTNILIYAHDTDQKAKHSVARKLITELLQDRRLVVSPQVLQEFYVNVTRKIRKPLAKAIARDIVRDFSVWSIDTSPSDISTAFRIEDQSKISFWDALICASAIKCGAKTLLSEDLNPGQIIAGILVTNPFA